MGQPTTTATMKLNISFPANGSQKLIEIEDDRELRVFMDKRMGQEVPGDSVGDEFKGYIFKITGGNDKQGFPMKQGVMHPTRVRLLLSDGHSCYRPRRTGERKRKSVRGCIVGMDLSVLALAIVKKGDAVLPRSGDSLASARRTMSASSSFDVKSSQRRRAASHTPSHQRCCQRLRQNPPEACRRGEAGEDRGQEAPRLVDAQVSVCRRGHGEARGMIHVWSCRRFAASTAFMYGV